jgi:putative ABC transport system ATP-binding protein
MIGTMTMQAEPRAARAASANTLVELRDVVKFYKRGAETVEVLDHLELEVPRGDFLALMAPSGSGKSTLLNIIGGIDKPNAGDVIVDGEAIQRLGDSALAKWRARHIGFVFQLYHLLPALTAEQNVELPLVLTGLKRRERKKRANAALTVAGVADRAQFRPTELSGGQQQRVAIARAIVADPTILLCDEPTGDLDRKAGDDILALLHVLSAEHGKTVILVTHDPHAAARARRTLFLVKGKLAEEPEA